ncbi:MAG: hypothetical protein HY825_16850 [Acidobacteria bacterium]|nr:hypothetical protein [Acidobacteriota bacterium]
MNTTTTRIANVIIVLTLAAAACSQPPDDDGGGRPDTARDDADGGADDDAAADGDADDGVDGDSPGDSDVSDTPCDPDACSADCVAGGWRVGTCTAGGCECSDAPPWCGDASCGPDELCGADGLGDGLDNDCDDSVDETCACEGMGVTRECFPGDPATCPPGLPCRGDCVRGVEACSEFLNWGECAGAIVPQPEVCDGADNDCDGDYDEGLTGCESPIDCPGSVSAAPMTWVALDGTAIFGGSFDTWSWELLCPSTIPVDLCPLPEEPAVRDTRVYLVASGTYRARATVTVGSDAYRCEFALLVQGDGLRVELNWDTQGSGHGNTDVDLHLHKWGTETPFFGGDDCYYANCNAGDYAAGGGAEWGLDDSPDVSACVDAPHGEGAGWAARGSCHNPRLDVDVVSCNPAVTDPAGLFYCSPENINVDAPPLGQPMRIMVHYFSALFYAGETNVTVNVYCGGALRATFGPQPLLNGSGLGGNDAWMVADVQFETDECGTIDCRIAPIADADGNPVILRDESFGPSWSGF